MKNRRILFIGVGLLLVGIAGKFILPGDYSFFYGIATGAGVTLILLENR